MRISVCVSFWWNIENGGMNGIEINKNRSNNGVSKRGKETPQPRRPSSNCGGNAARGSLLAVPPSRRISAEPSSKPSASSAPTLYDHYHSSLFKKYVPSLSAAICTLSKPPFCCERAFGISGVPFNRRNYIPATHGWYRRTTGPLSGDRAPSKWLPFRRPALGCWERWGKGAGWGGELIAKKS